MDILSIFGDNIKDNIIFSNQEFLDPVTFLCISEINAEVHFQDCIFQDYFSIYASIFKKGLKIEGCVFNKKFSLIASQVQVERFDLSRNEFKAEFEIIDSVFFQETRFHKNSFALGVNFFSKNPESFGAINFESGLEIS